MVLKRKKKVAHVIYDDGPGGGPRTVVQQLILAQQRFDLHVFHGGRGCIVDYCEKTGLHHTKIPLDKKRKLLLGFFHLLWGVFRFKPDALVLHGQWAAPVGAIVGRLAGIKTMIYIVHWPSFFTDWDLFRVLRNHLAERIPCRMASLVVFLSEGNRYEFLIRKLVRQVVR